MPKAMLMKAGEYTKEVTKAGKLYRNIFTVDKLQANVTHMLPGAKGQAFKHTGQEIHVMMRGEVEFVVGDEKFILQEGDMLYHHSDAPHKATNIGKVEAVYVTISTPPSFTLFNR